MWKYRNSKSWGNTIISDYNFAIIYKLGKILLYDKIQKMHLTSREVYKSGAYQGK